MKKTIVSNFFTTINFGVFVNVFYYLFKLNKKKYPELLSNKLLSYLGLEKKSKAICFYNARSALFHGIQLLGLKSGDEVIIQAYTCVSVPNSIIHAGVKPVYVDVDQTLNMDPDFLQRKITKRTKAIMVQHTFGNPANLEKIIKVCKNNNLFLIEDCAHSLGAEYQGQKVGTFGDISFFSLGRDKVVSAVNGGLLVVNNGSFHKYLPSITNQLRRLPIELWLQNIIYLLVSYMSFRLYDFAKLGKIMILLAKKTKIIPEILSVGEKSCHDMTFFYRYPRILAFIALGEFKKLDLYNHKRQKFAKIYKENLTLPTVKSYPDIQNIFLRYVVFVQNPDKILQILKNYNIFLGDWYQQVIAPKNVNYHNAMYTKGTCPNAEKFASHSINLPCHPNLSTKQVEKVVKLIIIETMNDFFKL